MIRSAVLNDIDALVALENRSFETDRISRRSFRHLLTRGRAFTLVDEEEGALRGYAMVLLHTGTSLARLYSIAVAPEYRKLGVARGLVEAAEQEALKRDCVVMRLEVRVDNCLSQALFRHLGYRQFGTYQDYYEDHADAVRMEKPLAPHLRSDLVRVPYYRQTLDFTCGPASVMMAMKALDPAVELDRSAEIRLWREATTVFMTSGHGGCGPYGLALSVHRRGFDVEVYVNDEGALFVDSVRSEEKKEVIRLAQEDFLRELKQVPVPVHYRQLSLEEMQTKADEGAVPVVLISSYRIYREKFPHWVVVAGFDDRFVYAHDPFVDVEQEKTQTDSMSMPILKKDFERMSRYGKSGLRAALLIKKREAR